MEYGNAKASVAYQGSGPMMGANAPDTQRAFDSMLDNMGKQLAGIAEGVARVNQFRNRLLNQKPESVGKDSAPTPAPQTIEARLSSMIHMANNIGDHLNSIAGELERAA